MLVAARRGELLRSAAMGRRDVSRAQGAAAGARAQHRARRRRRVRARTSRRTKRRCGCCSKRSSTRATRPGEEIALALDVASTEFFADGVYTLAGEGRKFTSPEFGAYLADLCDRYPIVSIEDGMAEDDWDGWRALTEQLGARVQLVGDDLFVTNSERLARGDRARRRELGAREGQPDRHAHRDARHRGARGRAGYTSVMSHRSGETEDTTIADLAVATNCGQIKTGAPARSDRVAKYNQLLRIEERARRRRRVPRARRAFAGRRLMTDGRARRAHAELGRARRVVAIVVAGRSSRSCSCSCSRPARTSRSAATWTTPVTTCDVMQRAERAARRRGGAVEDAGGDRADRTRAVPLRVSRASRRTP